MTALEQANRGTAKDAPDGLRFRARGGKVGIGIGGLVGGVPVCLVTDLTPEAAELLASQIVELAALARRGQEWPPPKPEAP